MIISNCPKTKEELIKFYNDLDKSSAKSDKAMRKLLEASYETVSETGACSSRLDEIKVFCKKMGHKKIGAAYCKGLKDYGEKVDSALSYDFEVFSVCCNVCGINKSDIQVKQIKPEAVEAACNPIGQALALNDKKVDFVVKCGFCLGHDLIFSKTINAPTTTLVVKDRKFKHRTFDIF
ncbi:MAG: DUF1847 domain-containing protein [Nanoarchaeota archaeon]|nr:DUF1847 domain-containing protein [Nanoarchaeota archaeon]